MTIRRFHWSVCLCTCATLILWTMASACSSNPKEPAQTGTHTEQSSGDAQGSSEGAGDTSSGGDSNTANTNSDSNGGTSPAVAPGEPRDAAKVYWVGHSLISATDSEFEGAQRLTALLGELAEAGGQSYGFYRHTTPGAPLGWNWGRDQRAWAEQRDRMKLLIDASHADYGSFDVMVVTEAVPIPGHYEWSDSSFFARRFFCAAREANPDAELYLYETWPNFQGSDEAHVSRYFNSRSDWDFVHVLREEHAIWVSIAEEAGDPSRAGAAPEDYTWQGDGADPGDCDQSFTVHLVPVGSGVANLIERLRARRDGDDWSMPGAIEGGRFTELDLWQNPLTDFPQDTTTTAHGGELDDIHPSHSLAYFNALVHYATVYRRDPRGLPALNGVPDNIAEIMQEVAWETVIHEPLSGVSGP